MNDLEKAIYTAIGEASLCWSEKPTGVFDSDLASDIAQSLIETVKAYYEPIIIDQARKIYAQTKMIESFNKPSGIL